jgi:hypothetical protein
VPRDGSVPRDRSAASIDPLDGAPKVVRIEVGVELRGGQLCVPGQLLFAFERDL